ARRNGLVPADAYRVRLVTPRTESYTQDMAVSRRTVTVLFADVADSTPLGERLDPETVRQVMSRWFERMSEVLERHGGTVEKFIGDAVMAVFGIPDLHEDDALRAVRAATELRVALAQLNEELERELGVRIGIRVGVNSGEVVAGDGTGGQMLVTGDPVNVAKRLEEAARCAVKPRHSRGAVSRTATASPSGRSYRSSARSAATRAFVSCWPGSRTASSWPSECSARSARPARRPLAARCSGPCGGCSKRPLATNRSS